MSELEAFKEKFKTEKLALYETEHWLWSLRPLQGTVGSGVLSLKRECPVFSQATREEFIDLEHMIKVIESTLQKTFDYDVINYLMLMMVDKQVHYHVFPRYKRDIVLKGKRYIDRNWPKPPELAGDLLATDEMLNIAEAIKKNLI